MLILLGWYLLGLLGNLFFLIQKNIEGEKLSAIWCWVKNHQKTALLGFMTYSLLFILWGTTSTLEILGMNQGEFSGLVVLLGYNSNSIFGEIKKQKLGKRIK